MSAFLIVPRDGALAVVGYGRSAVLPGRRRPHSVRGLSLQVYQNAWPAWKVWGVVCSSRQHRDLTLQDMIAELVSRPAGASNK